MSAFLKDFADFVREKDYAVFRVAEMQGEHEPETVEIRPGAPCQNIYSVSKAFAVTAVGVLFDRGMLSPDDRVTNLLHEYLLPDMDPHWSEMTLDMVLRHHCGMKPNELDIDVFGYHGFGTDDFLSYLFSRKLAGHPAEHPAYTDAAYYLVTRIISAVTGEKMDDFLRREVLDPLGCGEVAFSKCPKGYPMGATGMYMSAADMTRLGKLYLDGGRFRGKPILSRAFVDRALTAPYELSPHGDGYGKGGMNGQMLLCLPKQDRAVAFSAYMGSGSREMIDFCLSYKA